MSNVIVDINLRRIYRLTYSVLVFGLFSLQSVAASEFGSSSVRVENPLSGLTDILPVDEAFRLTSTKMDGSAVLYWQIQPGYYLYKHRLQVDANKPIGELLIPPGIPKTDEYFGAVEVYFDELEVIVPIINDRQGKMSTELSLSVSFQGCAEAGVCYPPQKILVRP